VRRQREDWQRDATRHLATGRTVEALRAYDDHGHVHAAPTREVRELNQLARDRLRTADQLGEDMEVRVARGERTFAAGDRVLFLRNERSLDVKNGTLGTVERINHHSLTVQLDSGRSVGFDL
jgi:ATP-dependent exoDNAse (exonuclease V) alpha subunit